MEYAHSAAVIVNLSCLVSPAPSCPAAVGGAQTVMRQEAHAPETLQQDLCTYKARNQS
jgi:hypothetical protein